MWLQQTCPGHSLHTWCLAQAKKYERMNKWASALWKGFMEIADDCESDSQQYVLIIYSLKQNYWALRNVFPHSAWGRYSSVRTVSAWDETYMRCWNQRLGWDRKPRKACDGLEGQQWLHHGFSGRRKPWPTDPMLCLFHKPWPAAL